jgi:hypothetical protein
MNDLAEVLHEQADVSRPRPDLDSVLRRSRVLHRRRRGLRTATALVAIAAVVAIGVGVATSQGGGDHVAAGGATGPLPALLIGGQPVHSLERTDSGATTGPQTVVLREPDGSLGHHGAVVTFPVATPIAGSSVTIDGAAGRMARGEVVWAMGPAYARVRGDLPDAVLLAIARATSERGGRPEVTAPPGVRVVFAGPYRAPFVHEARYGSAELGEGPSLGNGLAYTGVFSAGGFEDRLYATQGRTGFRVQGHPAVLSTVQGGNGTLAWELAPGRIALVGYSGMSLSQDAAKALTRIADRSHLVSAARWATFHAYVAPQTIDFG